MTRENIASSSSTQPRLDVRELQARLYREVGVAAVAAALHVGGARNVEPLRPASPAAPTCKNLAA